MTVFILLLIAIVLAGARIMLLFRETVADMKLASRHRRRRAPPL